MKKILLVIILAAGMHAVSSQAITKEEFLSSVSTTEKAKAFMQEFYVRLGSPAVVNECSVFVTRTISGKEYFVAKEFVTETNSLATEQTTFGIVIDPSVTNTWIRTLPLDDYRKFLKTGDKTILGEPDLDPTSD
jgi:hypothetical protein